MSAASQPAAAYLGITQVDKAYGAAVVLDGVDLAVDKGEFIALLGPSGCGKTTLLRIIAGLVQPDGGTVILAGKDVTRLPPHRRNIGVVFQNYALFPHLTVAENVGFGLAVRRVARADRAPRVAEALRLVQMEDYAARRISALSGGQQQRVALARALAFAPSLLLLDEPLAALDRKLRESVQVELRQLIRRLGITTVFVTHDQEEALILADRIGVMNQGRLEQLAAPRELYAKPRSRFVLDFVGRSCLIAGRVVGTAEGLVSVDTAHGRIQAPGSFMSGAAVEIGLRPEALRLGRGSDGGMNSITATVTDRIFLGSRLVMTLAAGPGERLLAELDAADAEAASGETVTLSWPAVDTLVFPAGAAG
ncbi:ABC transporter ATP-binding protein [Elioraea sp.]|uniref:ABC transporter ATP-binding protein n=1 Tax=Elioraea sp. TaxID=2185103 RepID=UPI0025C34A1B|nr:ABC transporter ATP-binding protein [Elioraea sp.]